MNSWLVWRVVKLVAVVALAVGAGAAVSAGSRGARLRAVHAAVVPGFIAAWIAGWMMLKLTARGLTEPWILLGLLASGVALDGAYRGAHRLGRHRQAGGMAVGGLLASVALMVVRPSEAPLILGLGLGGLALGAPLGALLASDAGGLGTGDRRRAFQGFAAIAWLEGTSFVVLMVAMPLRMVAGIDLDGDTGLLGWVHGTLFVVYLQALVAMRWALGWPLGRLAVGFVAGVLPFGTFVFERWVARREPLDG